MRKIFLTVAAILFMQTSAHAYGIFWYDLASDLPQWKKVVIFPLSYTSDKNRYLIDRDEKSLLYWENKHLMERFEKKIKNLHTVRLAPGIKEKDEILIDKFSVLLQPYPDEKTRAAAVFEQTGADMYIFPRFKEKRVQVDVSPRTEVTVQLSSWTEISGSQNSDGIYDKLKGVRVVTDPASKLPLNFYVTGTVDTWKLISTWNPPRATTTSTLIETKESEWRDANGKKHKMYTRKYRDEIKDHFAYWSFLGT